jgi:hypothetical protein
MEVFSSAETTYSFADKGLPSQTRLYRSRTRGLGGEARVADEDPGLVLPGFDRDFG